MPSNPMTPDRAEATPTEIRRWRQYLADERAEAAVYRDLAGRRTVGKNEKSSSAWLRRNAGTKRTGLPF